MYSTEAWGKLSKEASFSKFQIQRNVPGDDDVQFEVGQDTIWINGMVFLIGSIISTKIYLKIIADFYHWMTGCDVGEILWHLPHRCSLCRKDFCHIEGYNVKLVLQLGQSVAVPTLWYMLQYPLVPGHELAGVVTKVGSNVKDVKVSKWTTDLTT